MGKTQGELLQETLVNKFPNIGRERPERKEQAHHFCEGYKRFLDGAKTERECVQYSISLLKKAGYTVFDPKKTYQPGDKVYVNHREKALIATTFGTQSMAEGLRLNGAHIDAPRLDLKPLPLYEKEEMAFLKTHYYGGIRNYQWAAIPLAIHGVVVKQNGEKVVICIGEEDDDPVVTIPDLLPHLSAKQNMRPLKEGLRGEELNIIVGSTPFLDEAPLKQSVKLMILHLLHERYGMTERDFLRAEIEIVPAFKAKDVGLDRSMIGAYGQDDRVCAYTALMAELECQRPVYTTVTILADKEEIGSDGNTGLNSDFVLHHIQYLSEMAGVNDKDVCKNSICLSSDVNAAYDPNFPDVYEKNNSCFINRGCVLTKYTGSRGKFSTSDASAELMAKVISILDEAGVYWQSGELGAVDAGGGATIAKHVAQMNIEVVDLGVPILSMHSPFELSSKLDVYDTYLAFRAFYQ